MKCPNCQQELNTQATFCGNCGWQVAQNQPPVPTPSNNNETPASPANNQENIPGSINQNPPAQESFLPNQAQQQMPGYVGSEMNQPQQGGGKAIAALILGICAIPGAIIPILGIVLGVIAIILGTLSMKTFRKKLAIAGLILGIIGILLSLFNFVWSFNLIKSAEEAGNSFLTKIENEKIKDAYEQTSNLFKEETDENDFAIFVYSVGEVPLSRAEVGNYDPVYTEEGIAINLEYSVKDKGETYTIDMQLLRKKGEWFVNAIFIN